MKGFKYTTVINNKAVIDLGLDLDIIDMAIFDFIKDFAIKAQKKQENNVEYFFVKWSVISESLPLIGIKTRQGIYARLQKLKNANLIIPHEQNQILGESWFCFGQNCIYFQ